MTWRTNGCSAPLVGDTGLSFNFRNSCRRHDFGYRNLKLLDRRYGGGFWNPTSRRRVDQQFLADMKAHCHTRALWLRPTCLGWAQTYYIAVRVFMAGMERLADKEITRDAFLEAMESARIDVPISGGVDYSNAQRIGLDGMAFAKYVKNYTDATKAFVTVDGMKSIGQLLGE